MKRSIIFCTVLLLACAGCGGGGSGKRDLPSPVKTSLPDNLPEDVVVYPGAEVESAYTAPAGGTLKLFTADDFAKVVEYYEAELPARGWEIPAGSPQEDQATFHCIRDKARFQTVNIRAGSKTQISISFGDNPSQ